LTPEVYLNNVQRLNYILTANMPPVHYKNKGLPNAVQGNDLRLY